MAALEILEIPCYHMQTMMADMDVQVGLWEDAREGRADWERIFDGFDSTVDWPAAYHYKELMEVYPEVCEFLEVDVPGQELPQVWDTEAFKAGITGGALAAVNAYWESRDTASHTITAGTPVSAASKASS